MEQAGLTDASGLHAHSASEAERVGSAMQGTHDGLAHPVLSADSIKES